MAEPVGPRAAGARHTTNDRLLAILVDGARPDVIEKLVAAGDMPRFKQHIVDRGGFRTGTSVFPSVSGPAHLPILTGVHPGRADLPGIRWAERPRGKRGNFAFRTRSYMAPFRARKLTRDIPADVTTLFQHVPGLADVNTWFVRGCPGRARLTRFSKAAAFVRAFTTKDWYSSDRQAESAVLRAWQRGFPSVSAVFPAVDELGHRFGPLTDESYEAYRRFDVIFGRLVDAMTRAGTLDRTLIVLTSDHGQTGTHTHVDIDDLVAEVYPKTLAYPRLWRHLFDAEAAAMVSGNSLANVYLMGPAGWHQRPDFEAPTSRAATLVARLVEHPAIAHVIHRRADGGFLVRARDGHAVVEPIADDGASPRVRYSTTGVDPFGYGAWDGVLDRRAVAARTMASAYPDAPWQLIEFFRSRRAGDLVVCARAGFDLRSRFEYQPHHGSHGCLDREHMLVPMALNARWAVPADEPLAAVDLFPSLLATLGLDVPAGRSGRVVPIETAE